MKISRGAWLNPFAAFLRFVGTTIQCPLTLLLLLLHLAVLFSISVPPTSVMLFPLSVLVIYACDKDGENATEYFFVQKQTTFQELLKRNDATSQTATPPPNH